jgi:hypothetical protein
MMGNHKNRVRSIRHISVFLIFVAALFVASEYLWAGKAEQGLLPARFITSQGERAVKLEIVNTPSGRARGLMFRKEMAEDRGMLFIFPEERENSFYMKNTYISLDMFFVGADRKVVGIIENAPILNEQSRTVGKPSLYVIELVSGSAKRLGIDIGTEIIFDGTLPAAL